MVCRQNLLVILAAAIWSAPQAACLQPLPDRLHSQKYVVRGPCFKPSFTDALVLPPSAYQASAIPRAACPALAVTDMQRRKAMPKFSFNSSDPLCTIPNTWGPVSPQYPVMAQGIPNKCSAEAFLQARVLYTIEWILSQNLSYCHHHSPFWVAPNTRALSGDKLRVFITLAGETNSTDPVSDPSNPDGSGLGTGQATCTGPWGGARTPWKGFDCTSFTSFVYNFAFGAYLNAGTPAQACLPGTAPGRVVPGVTAVETNSANNTVLRAAYAALKPADILYIIGDSALATITHAVFWTGYHVDFHTTGQALSYDTVAANLPASAAGASSQRVEALRWMVKQNATGMPVPVIADSTYAGPSHRPFWGWYANNFSHARRLILPPATFVKDPAFLAYNGAGAGTCTNLEYLARHTTGHPPPTAGHPPPNSSHVPPAGGLPPSTAGRPPPAAGHPPPTAGHAQPATGNPPPTVAHPPPMAGHPPPVGGHPPPAAGHPPPRS